MLLLLSLSAAPGEESTLLQRECIVCHEKQKIPSGPIYRRYLLKYSSKEIIGEKIFSYLKHPDKNSSIMPPQFFNKFPVKRATELNDKALRQRIKAYIDRYDVNKRFFVPQNASRKIQ